MKKILLILCLGNCLFTGFGQSVTILPQTIDKQNSGNNDITTTSYNKSPSIIGLRVNGTVAAKTPILSGNLIMEIAAKGYDGNSFYNGGRINFKATQNWNNLTNGAAITFETAPNVGNPSAVERMIINHDGNVGIGLSNPNEILDVNGRMRIRHTVIGGSPYTSGLWLNNSTNSLNGADGAFVGMETDNKLGFYIGNAWRFGVNSSGEISTTSMVGTGFRMVLASPDGVLLSNFQPQVWSISAGTFTPTTSGSAQFVKSTTSAYFSSGSSIMIAPINLPTGVNVTEIVVFYSNSDPVNTLSVRLDALVLANSNLGGVNTPIIASGNLGMVTGIQSANLTLQSGQNLIDNANRAYNLRVSSDVWSNKMVIYGVKITYSY